MAESDEMGMFGLGENGEGYISEKMRKIFKMFD